MSALFRATKTSQRARMLAASGAALALTACGYLPGSDRDTVLHGTSWNLVQIENQATVTRLQTALQERHTITFNRDGSLALGLDCNRGRGTWRARETGQQAGTIVISEVSSTRAFCPEPSFGDDLSAGLPEARDFSIAPQNGMLRITSSDTLYVFERVLDR